MSRRFKSYLHWEWHILKSAARESYDIFKEVRNSVLATLLAAGFFLLFALSEYIDFESVVRGSVGIVLLALLFFGWFLATTPYKLHSELTNKANELERGLAPRMVIERVVIHSGIHKIRGDDEIPVDVEVRKIKILVRNPGKAQLKNCKALLIKAERENGGSWLCQESEIIELLWDTSVSGHELSLDHNIARFINVMQFSATENRLRHGQSVPIQLWRFFNELGTYRLYVQVAATDSATEEICIEIEQNANFDATVVRRL